MRTSKIFKYWTAIRRNSSQNWSAYWTTLWQSLVSAVVEDAAPNKVVLTFSNADIKSVAADFSIAGKTITLLERDATNKVFTLTLSAAITYGEVLTVQLKALTAHAITNNVLYFMTLTTVGTGAGVSTLRMSVSSNIVVTLTGTAKFYTDAAGTANESSTWNLTSGAERTIYLKCPTDTPVIKFSDPTKIINIGNGVDGWVSGAHAARLTIPTTELTTLQQLRIAGTSTITGQLPSTLLNLSLGNSTTWSYNGALPSGLTYLLLSGALVAWTYNGALPTGLTFLRLNGDNIAWTYNGALPTGVTSLLLVGAAIAWTYNGTLPTGLTYINISGDNINWTGLNVGNNGNIATFILTNYRSAKMSSADMVTLLTQMKNRTGSLPATVTVNDFADYASPPQAVTDAVSALKTAKSITTINLGA